MRGPGFFSLPPAPAPVADPASLGPSGSERTVYIWNPFIQNPVYKLDGHNSVLVDVCFGNSSQLITLDVAKTIRVWDLRTFTVLQSFTDPAMYYPENKLTSMVCDHKRERILCGSTFPVMWHLQRPLPSQSDNYSGHTKPLVSVLYNSHFDQVLPSRRRRYGDINRPLGPGYRRRMKGTGNGRLEDGRRLESGLRGLEGIS